MAKQIDVANVSAKPLKRLRLLGPDYNGAFSQQLDDPEFKACSDCLIIGDGTRLITREELEVIKGRISKDTQIELVGHGTAIDGEHLIGLFKGEGMGHTSAVLTFLNGLISHPLQVYIHSCHSGAANANIALLKAGSKLITSSEPDDVSYSAALQDDPSFTLSLEERFLRSIRTFSQVLTLNQKLSSGEIFKYQYRPFSNQLITGIRTAQTFIKKAEKDFIRTCKDKLEIELPKLPEVTEEQAKTELTKHFKYIIALGKLDNKPELVKLLGPNDVIYGNPVIYIAACRSAKAFHLLVQAGADVNAKDINGDPVIYIAACHSAKAFHLLVQAGADVNARNRYGNPIIWWSAYWHAQEAFKLLLEAGADPSAVGKDGSNVFDLIERTPKLQEVLAAYKAKLNAELEAQKAMKAQYEAGQSSTKVADEDMKKLEEKYVRLFTPAEKETFYKEKERQVPPALEKASAISRDNNIPKELGGSNAMEISSGPPKSQALPDKPELQKSRFSPSENNIPQQEATLFAPVNPPSLSVNVEQSQRAFRTLSASNDSQHMPTLSTKAAAVPPDKLSANPPTSNQTPYDMVIILGLDDSGAFKKYLDSCSPQGVGNCIQIGEGTRDVTFDEIKEKLAGRIDRHTQIEIFGHGSVKDGKHHVMLVRKESSETDLLLDLLDSLTPDPIKCALTSCHGGAIHPSLKKGSTVITTAEPDLPASAEFNIVQMNENWRKLSPESQVLLAMTETPETITYYRSLEVGKNLTHVYRPFYNRAPVHTETVENLVQFAQMEFRSRLLDNDIVYPEALQPIPKMSAESAESLIKKEIRLQNILEGYGKVKINKENLHVNYQLLRNAIDDRSALEGFLNAGMNPNFYGNSEPLLSIAIQRGLRYSIEILLRNGAEISVLSDREVTKLLTVINPQDLIAKGLIPINKPLGGKLPLQWVIDSTWQATELLRNGANLRLLPQEDIIKLFKQSIMHDERDIMERLINDGCVPINEPVEGKLPLQWAIDSESPVENILIKNGANLKLITHSDAKKLFIKLTRPFRGKPEIIAQLVSEKLIPIDEPIEGKLPLQWVILSAKNNPSQPLMSEYSKLFSLLLQNGAQLSTLSEAERKTLFDIADKSNKAGNSELSTLIRQEQAQLAQPELDMQKAQLSHSEKQTPQQTHQAATLPAPVNPSPLSANTKQRESALSLLIPDIAPLPAKASASSLKLSEKSLLNPSQTSSAARGTVNSLAQHNTNTGRTYKDKPSNWKPQEITAKDLVPSITFAPDAALALGMLAGSFQDPHRAKWQAWEEEKFPGKGRLAEDGEEAQLLKRMDALWEKQNELDNKHLQPSRKFLLDKAEQFRSNRFMQPFIDELSWRKKRELDELRDAQFALENFENRLDDRISKGELTVDDIEWSNKHLKKIEDQLAELSKESAAQIRSDVSMEQQGQLQKANEAIATAKAKLQEQQDQTKSFGSRLLGFVTGNKAITEQNIARLEKERDELSKGILSTVAVGPKGSRKKRTASADVILRPDGTPQGIRINRHKRKSGPINSAM